MADNNYLFYKQRQLPLFYARISHDGCAVLIDEPLGITAKEIKEILKQNPHSQLW